jgi:hypothetical protein
MQNDHPPNRVRTRLLGRDRLSADHLGGLIWLVFGTALFYGSWTMDRLESQNINPVTAPGLLPGLIGIGIVAFALVLLFRRRASRAHTFGGDSVLGSEAAEPHEPAGEWKRLLLSWVLCVGFAGLLLGRGMPFWLLAGGFVFLHILILDDPERVDSRSLTRRALVAAAVAVCTTVAVTVIFQNLFYVRLP